eukprot:COSAG01_NODE_872_length_12988_cov_4.918846_7_plen_653_part_00
MRLCRSSQLVLTKEVPACLNAKCLVFSKLAEVYTRTEQSSHASKMIAQGLDLAIVEESELWARRFRLLSVAANFTFGKLVDAHQQLLKLHEQAVSCGELATEVTCTLMQLQVAALSCPDKISLQKLLGTGDNLLSKLLGASSTATDAGSAAPENMLQSASAVSMPAAVAELKFMLTIAHAVYSMRFDLPNAEPHFGSKPEARIKAALKGLLAAPATDKMTSGVPTHPVTTGLWLPKQLRCALLFLFGARTRRTRDTARALLDVKRGEATVDSWLSISNTYEDQGDAQPKACTGCRTAVANAALQIKSALAEVAYHLLTTQCDFAQASQKLFCIKQLAATFPDTFPQAEHGARIAFLTAEYAFSVGDLDAASAWCERALAALPASAASAASTSAAAAASAAASAVVLEGATPTDPPVLVLRNACLLLQGRGNVLLDPLSLNACNGLLSALLTPAGFLTGAGAIALATGDKNGAVAALGQIAQPNVKQPELGVQHAAAAKLGKALLMQQTDQYQPAKTCGMEAFTLCQGGNLQLTANCLCLLGEVYSALGAAEAAQMLQIAAQTASQLQDTVTHKLALARMLTLIVKMHGKHSTQALEAQGALDTKVGEIEQAIAAAKVTWQHWGVVTLDPPTAAATGGSGDYGAAATPSHGSG